MQDRPSHLAVRRSRRHAERLLKTTRLSEASGKKLVLDVAEDLWYRFNTPTTLGLYLCVKHGDLLSVLKHTVKPENYLHASDFHLDYQAVSLLKKCPFSDMEFKTIRDSATREKFLDAERQCKETNARFRARSTGGRSTASVESVLFRAQRKISNWLGEGPSPHEWALRCRFGPGADDLTQGPAVGPYHKLSALSSTDDFADGALALALDHPAWGRALGFPNSPEENSEGDMGSITQNLTPGNKVTFVPKTALIERSIAIEPRMNIYAQLGLGALIREALHKRANLDLNTQAPNQDLAYDASRFGHLATVDLSSASDTIATEVVRDLLPEGWFTALDWCRSKNGKLDNSWFKYEKFSSMGNGYTFELESMIFYALTQSVCEHLELSTWYNRVFGDDIICPVEAVALLEEVLIYCGFTVNTGKSYTSGVFRESCGSDFFDATNVRPYFCKKVPSDVKDLFGLANGLRRAGRGAGHSCYVDRRFRPAWLRTVRRIPEPLRSLYQPIVVTGRVWGFDIQAGDGGLVLNPDEFLSTAFARFCREYQVGYYFGMAVPRPWQRSVDDKTPNLTLLYALYRNRDGCLADCVPGIVTGRGTVGQSLTTRAYARVLGDLGPWL